MALLISLFLRPFPFPFLWAIWGAILLGYLVPSRLLALPDCGSILSDEQARSLATNEEWGIVDTQCRTKDSSYNHENGYQCTINLNNGLTSTDRYTSHNFAALRLCGATGAEPQQEEDLLAWFNKPLQGFPEGGPPGWVSTSISVNSTFQFAYDTWLERKKTHALHVLQDLLATHYPEESKTQEFDYGSVACLPPFTELCAEEWARAMVYHGGDPVDVARAVQGFLALSAGFYGALALAIWKGPEELVKSLQAFADYINEKFKGWTQSEVRLCEGLRKGGDKLTVDTYNSAKVTLKYLYDLKENSKYAYAVFLAAQEASKAMGWSPEVPVLNPPSESGWEWITPGELAQKYLFGVIPKGLFRYPLLWLYEDHKATKQGFDYACEGVRKDLAYTSEISFAKNPWLRLNLLRSAGTLRNESLSLPPGFLVRLSLWYELFLRFYGVHLKEIELSGIMDPSQKLRISGAPVVGNEQYAFGFVTHKLHFKPEKILFLSLHAQALYGYLLTQELVASLKEGEVGEALNLAIAQDPRLKQALCVVPGVVRFPAVLRDPMRAAHANKGGVMGKWIEFCDREPVGRMLRIMGKLSTMQNPLDLFALEGFLILAHRTPEGVKIHRILVPPANKYMVEGKAAIFAIASALAGEKPLPSGLSGELNDNNNLFALAQFGKPWPDEGTRYFLSEAGVQGTVPFLTATGTITRKGEGPQSFALDMLIVPPSRLPTSLPKSFTLGALTLEDLVSRLQDLGGKPSGRAQTALTQLRGQQGELTLFGLNNNEVIDQGGYLDESLIPTDPRVPDDPSTIHPSPGASAIYSDGEGRYLYLALFSPGKTPEAYGTFVGVKIRRFVPPSSPAQNPPPPAAQADQGSGTGSGQCENIVESVVSVGSALLLGKKTCDF